MSNTLKSTLRTYKSVIYRLLLPGQNQGTIENITNHFRYNDELSTSGQPTKKQFKKISEAGYDVVINLAPYDLIEAPLKDEPEIVVAFGMKYIHIPVHFWNPTYGDFDLFVGAMKNSAGKKVWVHCAAGMRASAFLYRYRCSILGEDKQVAIWDLREIWEPFGNWKKFTFSEAG